MNDLHGFEVLAILEAAARHLVAKRAYHELIYNLFVDGEFVSGGCVTELVPLRLWCQGLREEELEPLLRAI